MTASPSNDQENKIVNDDSKHPNQQLQRQQQQKHINKKPITHASLRRRVTVAMTSDETAQELQRKFTQKPTSIAVAGEHVMELEFTEEWDGSTPFYQHCIAGSMAGVAEHLLMYPFDTIKTYIQTTNNTNSRPNGASETIASTVSRATTTTRPTITAPASSTTNYGMWTILRRHVQSMAEFGRLWRGAQAMATGCIPAHALYFSSYEVIKSFFLKGSASSSSSSASSSSSSQQQQKAPNAGNNNSNTLGPFGSAVAGSTAAFCHDLIMVPADTIKQRLQLGYYRGMMDALRQMLQQEGAAGLYRALPVTLCTNLPYGAVMVTTNEYLRDMIMKQQQVTTLNVQTTLLAGCGAGMVAAAATAPLDRIKTKLQTQGLGVVAVVEEVTTTTTSAAATATTNRSLSTSTTVMARRPHLNTQTPKYKGLVDAFRSVVRQEGYAGLFRGIVPRVVTHTPSVAISWTVYEVLKVWLSSSNNE